MNTTQALDDLQNRIRSGYPVLWLRTYEEDRWEALLAGWPKRSNTGWSPGPRPTEPHQRSVTP